MAKQFDVSKEEIINSIEGSSTLWKDIQKENLIKGNLLCPLCSLIKNIYKVSFQKGSARGACLLCPAKYFGYFHICVGIQHVYSTPTITSDEMKSLRKTVLNSLTALKTTISKDNNYNRYVAEIVTTRKNNSSIEKKPEPTKRNIKNPPRRIFKTIR